MRPPAPAVTEAAASEPTAEAAPDYSRYEPLGMAPGGSAGRLYYQGRPVRVFEDFYPLGDGISAGMDYFDAAGAVDVRAVRDLSRLQTNPDGSTDPSGRLVRLEAAAQEEFDARDVEALLHPQQQSAYAGGPMPTDDELAALYAVYEPFGVHYDKALDRFTYQGQTVRSFVDVLSTNGEALSGAKFHGSLRVMGAYSEGTVDLRAVRDYASPDKNGEGWLTGVEADTQAEFDARTAAGSVGSWPPAK